MTIKELIKTAHSAAKEKGFWNKERDVAALLMLIVSECGEALEADRKGLLINKKPLPTPAMPVEIEWRQCHENYEVSNGGDVRSRDMFVDNGNGGHTKTGCVLKPGISGTGYRTVSLRGNTHKVARLVAEAFIDKPAGANVVNHVNGVKTDDWYTNLEWVTHAENNEHSHKTGLRDMTKVFSWDDRAAVLTELRSSSVFEVAERWDVHPSAIKRIRKDYGNLFSYFEYELADIVIRIADLCGGLDIEPMSLQIPLPKDVNIGAALFGITGALVHSVGAKGEVIDSPDPLWLGSAMGMTFSLAESQDIDLWRHIELKLAYNKTRAQMHGKTY